MLPNLVKGTNTLRRGRGLGGGCGCGGGGGRRRRGTYDECEWSVMARIEALDRPSVSFAAA